MAGPEPPGPPLIFDDLTEDTLRAAGSLTWARFGPALGAFVAEMDFGTAPVVTRTLQEAADGGRLGYLTAEAETDMARASWPGSTVTSSGSRDYGPVLPRARGGGAGRQPECGGLDFASPRPVLTAMIDRMGTAFRSR
jgi:hypothetical protein